jgi:hypothetical protein
MIALPFNLFQVDVKLNYQCGGNIYSEIGGLHEKSPEAQIVNSFFPRNPWMRKLLIKEELQKNTGCS